MIALEELDIVVVTYFDRKKNIETTAMFNNQITEEKVRELLRVMDPTYKLVNIAQ